MIHAKEASLIYLSTESGIDLSELDQDILQSAKEGRCEHYIAYISDINRWDPALEFLKNGYSVKFHSGNKILISWGS